MHELRTPWRWPLSLATALLVLALLAIGAARYYPAGDLSRFTPPSQATRPLVVLGDVTVVGDPEPVPEPEPDEEPLPEPEPELFRGLWSDYIVTLTEESLAASPSACPPRALSSTFDFTFIARPDTSAFSRLLWSADMQNTLRSDMLRQGLLMGYGRKSKDFQSRKALIFNEDWLDKADLR